MFRYITSFFRRLGKNYGFLVCGKQGVWKYILVYYILFRVYNHFA